MGLPRSPKAAWRVWLQRLAPYAITILVIVLILQKYSIDEIGAELEKGRAWPLLPIAMGFLSITLFVVSAADTVVMRSLLGDLRYADLVRTKAATAVLDIVGYAVAKGGYAVWVARHTGTNAAMAAGALLYVTASDLAAVSTLATIAVWNADDELAGPLRILAPAIGGTLIALKVLGPMGLLGRRHYFQIFTPWSKISWQAGLLQVVLRMAQLSLIVTATWVAALAFGMPIPFTVMATYMPVILVVSALPINVAGFGAAQAAWLLLDDWASGPQILAFQLLWGLSCGLTIVFRGLPFVRRFVAEIDEGGQGAASLQSASK